MKTRRGTEGEGDLGAHLGLLEIWLGPAMRSSIGIEAPLYAVSDEHSRDERE